MTGKHILSYRNFNQSRQPFTLRDKGLDCDRHKADTTQLFCKKGCPKEDSARVKRVPIWTFIKQLQRPVFTTYELSLISGKSLSVTTQALNNLVKDGLIFKIYRGVWAEAGNKYVSLYTVIQCLFPIGRVYVSFLSALHLQQIVEQIPQVVTVASLTHTRIIRTTIGDYYVHRIAPSFFAGFNWYKGKGDFLIAEPEKALVDCLYLSACKKRQYGYFPELHFPKAFSFKKVKDWIKKIPNAKISANAKKKLDKILQQKEAGKKCVGFAE